MVEEILGDVERRVGDDLESVPRQPRLFARGLEDLNRARRAARRSRRGPEDHGVARLRADDRLEQRRRGWVRDRQQRQHHANRLGYVLDVTLGILVDHPDGALVLEVVEEELGGDVVLYDLVLKDSETGLLHRQLGQFDSALEARHDHRPDDAIDGFLVERPAGLRRGLSSLHKAIKPSGLLVINLANWLDLGRRCHRI